MRIDEGMVEGDARRDGADRSTPKGTSIVQGLSCG
jgi:hypothetical protein